MKVGVLQADSVVEQFQPDHGNYPQMFELMLAGAAASIGIELFVQNFDVEHGEYPAEMADCDGYIITGSRRSVYEDEAWITQLGQYVQILNERKYKTVGICFGHQMIAEVLGGKTEGVKKGWGVGIHSSHIAEPSWFMQPMLNSFSLIYSHKDQVVRLPKDAELLATHEFCPNSMFCIGEHMLALQGHPEFDTAYAGDLMTWREQILGAETYAKGMASLDQPLLRDEVAQWIVRFFMGKDAI